MKMFPFYTMLILLNEKIFVFLANSKIFNLRLIFWSFRLWNGFSWKLLTQLDWILSSSTGYTTQLHKSGPNTDNKLLLSTTNNAQNSVAIVHLHELDTHSESKTVTDTTTTLLCTCKNICSVTTVLFCKQPEQPNCIVESFFSEETQEQTQKST